MVGQYLKPYVLYLPRTHIDSAAMPCRQLTVPLYDHLGLVTTALNLTCASEREDGLLMTSCLHWALCSDAIWRAQEPLCSTAVACIADTPTVIFYDMRMDLNMLDWVTMLYRLRTVKCLEMLITDALKLKHSYSVAVKCSLCIPGKRRWGVEMGYVPDEEWRET